MGVIVGEEEMKVIFYLALFAVGIAALPIAEEDTHIHGETGWFIPRVDGTFEWISKAQAEELWDLSEERALSTNPVSFYLYTKLNPTSGQKITATKKSIGSSNFNPKHPTRFAIHGWTQGYKDSMNTEITSAWLSHGDYNVIVVDWGRARSVEYASSVLAVPGAGKKVGDLILFLHQNYAMSLDTLDVIGHSLGAHVAGYAGKTVGSGKIHAIVGLDPALPLFSYDKPGKRLSSTDGFYVESIQTNGGKLGFLKPIGKGAFYPNGGKSQPGCGIDLTGSCSHGRSVTYYVEAVKKDDFPTVKCVDYEAAVDKKCGSTYSSTRMGAVTNAFMVAGNYYVPVNSKAPFGKSG